MKLPKSVKTLVYMKQGAGVKAVVGVSLPVFGAKATVNGVTYPDAFNQAEPYDRHTSVFYIPESELKPHTLITYTARLLGKKGACFTKKFYFNNPAFLTREHCEERGDNELKILFEEKESISQGVNYFHRIYTDKNTDYVHTFTLRIDPKFAGLYVGTPDDGYQSKNARATIPQMISDAEKSGHRILCGINGDFFDILGDFHPSGLCVKNSRVIANRNSQRPFVATLTDGSHVITDFSESPHILPGIAHAVSGLQLIVKDGKLYDTAPGEPFGETRHPRSAVGVCADGTVVLLVADGRIPAYSNGASLVDLGKLMLEEGVQRALNLDGGGSSAVYTKGKEGFILRSRPADLFKPNAMLIRKDFNSILVEEYKTNEV